MGFLSAEHVLPIAVMLAAAVLCVWAARRRPPDALLTVRRLIAVLIIAAWAGEYIADVAMGIWSVKYTLPLQLTDAISVVSAFALWTGSVRAVQIAYLLAMTATLQAIITPDLAHSFPEFLYFTYFTYHCAAVVGVCLLVFGERRSLARAAVGRAYLAALGWACVAGLADLITGGNYMYLNWKPEHVSLLNVMGRWPWYVLETALVLAPLLLWAAWGLAWLLQRLGAPAAPGGARPLRGAVARAD